MKIRRCPTAKRILLKPLPAIREVRAAPGAPWRPLAPTREEQDLPEREELREEHYNATITHFEPTHSDLWVLRVKPDHGGTDYTPGQYATLGLGYWEERVDDAIDPNLGDRWFKLIRRSYSISSRVLDDHGYLVDEGGLDELEFYIVLVPPTEDNIPELTPRLALKRPGDRIYLGPKVAGRYTLDSITNPAGTVMFFSTGTGEAPHNAMITELLRKGHHGPIVSAVSVRQSIDLGYEETHRELERRHHNYHYLPMPTREPDIAKRYIQDLIKDGDFARDGSLTRPGDHSRLHVRQPSDDRYSRRGWSLPRDRWRGRTPRRAGLHDRQTQAARQYPLRGVLVVSRSADYQYSS